MLLLCYFYIILVLISVLLRNFWFYSDFSLVTKMFNTKYDISYLYRLQDVY